MGIEMLARMSLPPFEGWVVLDGPFVTLVFFVVACVFLVGKRYPKKRASFSQRLALRTREGPQRLFRANVTESWPTCS